MILIMFEEIRKYIEGPETKNITLNPGDFLFRMEDEVRSVFLLLSGRLDLMRTRQDGSVIALHSFQEKSVVAEASVYSDRYHCDAVCIEQASLLETGSRTFRDRLHHNSDLSSAWAMYLARNLQTTRSRCEILTRKTLAGRLDGWLELNGGRLPPKGTWKHLASEIGVTPEALYRYLAKWQSRNVTQ